MRNKSCPVAEHLSADELRTKMSEASSIEQFRRYQVIFLRLTSPETPVSRVAELCSVAYRTVTQWTWLYNNLGPEGYVLSGRGGRRHSHLPEDAEKALLGGLASKAGNGQVVTVLSVKKAAEKLVGHELPKDYAYDLLHRHGWRKVMPRTHHPRRDSDKQEAFKKTFRNSWMPPAKASRNRQRED